ncbi:Ger(x)C family spore germination protein [Pseudobacillus sp. FSL P4-0506]|uniref:Ger(x)C family spore germination protein n=1 Tax=unclassified Pseudobacillus TaxID=2619284 RepID=UPI0030FCACD7
MSRKTLFLVISMLACLAILSGCGFKDIDKRGFVVAVGVDGTKDKKKPYRITLKLVVPTGAFKQAPKPTYDYLSIESATLAEGVRMLKTHTDKELDFSHAKVILLGKNILEHDARQTFDIFLRRRDFQGIAWVAVGDPSAEKVLKTNPTTDVPGSNALFNIFSDEGTESVYIVTTYVYDFARRLFETGLDPILPIIRATDKGQEYRTNETIVFKEGRKKVKLTPEKTKYYNLISGREERADIVVKKKGVHITIAAGKVQAKYKILTPANQAPVLKMTVDIDGIIEESQHPVPPEKLSLYSKYASEAVKRRALHLLEFLQENEVDPLGFGLRYKATRLHNRDLEAEWQRIYPRLKFDVEAKVTIKSTGVIK